MIAGWRARVSARRVAYKSSHKTTDTYWYDENNFKFRAMREVGAHFGLIEGHAPCTTAGALDAAAVDKKLWVGASAQGWSVVTTADCHSTYTAPDGRRFKRKDDARGWEPKHALLNPLVVRPSASVKQPKKKPAAPRQLAASKRSAAPEQPAALPSKRALSTEQRHCKRVRTATADQVTTHYTSLRDRDGKTHIEILSDDDDDEVEEEEEPSKPSPQERLQPPPQQQPQLSQPQLLPAPTPPNEAAAATPAGMAGVLAHLERIKLQQYAAQFDEQGYDDLDFLLKMSDAMLTEVAQAVGMKHGHECKFVLCFATGYGRRSA